MTKPTCPECGSSNLTATVLAYGKPVIADNGLLVVPEVDHINTDASKVTCDDCVFQAGQIRVNWPSADHDFTSGT